MTTDLAGDVRPVVTEFVAPGPGTWARDPVHTPRGVTPFVEEPRDRGMPKGMDESARRCGALMGRPVRAVVNGHLYMKREPIPPEDIPEYIAAAERFWAEKLWRADLERWNGEVKPDSYARNRALADVDVAGLSDAALADHLHACEENFALMSERHHIFNAAAMVPVGDFVVHAVEWGAGPPSELLALLRGSSAASAGKCPERDMLVAALRSDPDALELLDADGAGKAVEALCSRRGAVGSAMRDFAAFAGLRPVNGFDICEPIVLEQPEILLASIRDGLQQAGGDDGDATTAAIDAARARVPEEHRAEFDELLAEARLVYGLKDERGLYQDVWAVGIARHAILEAGRRLVARGLLHDPRDLTEATASDMRTLLLDGAGPSADDLAAAREFRESLRPEDAPPFLGDPPAPPELPSGLPPAITRTMRAMGFAGAAMFASTDAEHGASVVRGIGVNDGVYEGTARVLSSASEMDRIEDGDVLVIGATGEAFNLALPILGGIVTDHGGLLSHAAIVAREYGLPAVVGTRDGTTRIPDGARVRVDASAGEVHLLA